MKTPATPKRFVVSLIWPLILPLILTMGLTLLLALSMPVARAARPNGDDQLAHATEATLGTIRAFLNHHQLGPHLILYVGEEDQVQDWPLDHPAERYTAGPYTFLVDPQLGAIIEFGPQTPNAPPSQSHVPFPYTGETLQIMAREIVYDETRMNVIASEMQTAKATVSAANIYTFRWWGQASEGHSRPYIQVGLTQAGQLVSFVNAGFYEALAIVQPLEEGGIYPSPIKQLASPDGEWAAVFNTQVGNLVLTSARGARVAPFPTGAFVADAIWSPNSDYLLAVRNFWTQLPGEMPTATEPASIWRIPFDDNEVGAAEALFQPEFPVIYYSKEYTGPTEISWGSWSPDDQHLLFWFGPNYGRHDGHQPWVLDTKIGKAQQIAPSALPNPRYQSWSPDGGQLAISAGNYRSAQTNKWLNIVDTATGDVTTVVSSSTQIPGIVAWSPAGDKIAYAAVDTALTGPEWNDWMSLENPAIAGRRIYLLDVATGEVQRLNDLDEFQDAPVWQADGKRLYYVQRDGDMVSLVGFDLETHAVAKVVESTRPLPHAIGYYGQFQWDDLLAYAPDVLHISLPALTEVYTDATLGFTMHYPAGWKIVSGWLALSGWQAMPTLIPPDGATDLGPFGGRLHLAVEPLVYVEGDLESVLARVIEQAGPGQTLDRGASLVTYNQAQLEIDHQAAVRVETLGEFGEVNHLLLVLLDNAQGVVLRGQGDGRLFDAIVATLDFAP